MTSQYVSQQWSGLPAGVAGPGGASLERTQEDNPNFLYPGPYRRDLGGGVPQIIQRGFMRSLLGSIPDVGEALGNSRFFFQFNPQQIQRSVAVSGGLMNPLLQDPGQFSVATPGNATFSFDIFLNREAEVNAQSNYLLVTYADILLGGLPGAQGQTQGVITPEYEATIEQNPGKYGVLSDIQVLDNIIGQGITEKTISALAKIQSISSTWDTSESSAGGSVTGAAENAKTATEVNDALRNIQFGNSAFLISTPVRIVFSSMFMIDGFIQGSNVMFSKFSGNMVPTVCAINITVEAKYIGFAREKTYLTDSLSRAIENPNKDGTAISEPIVGNRAEYDLLRGWLSSLPDYQIVLVGMDDSDYNLWGVISENFNVAINRVLSFDDVRCQFGFRDNTTDDSVGSSNLARAFYEGKYAITIEHTPEVYVWRKFQTTAEQVQATNSNITRSNQPVGPGVIQWNEFSALTNSPTSRFTGSRDVLLLAINCQVAAASTYDTWRTFHAYGGTEGINNGTTSSKTKPEFAPQGKQANTVFSHSGKSKDEAKRAYLEESDWTEAKNFNFIVDIKLKIKATITSLENIGKTSEISFAIYKTVVQNADKQVGQVIKITTKDVPAG
jgi:hypothetical protein